ncbi:MAG: outer membrane beta-barrel protein [Chloroherpetonaceae bacterium]
MTKKRITLAAIALIALSVVSTEANAQFKGEALLGYGFADAYKLGFGVRAGKDGLIESQKQIYIGGVFAYHLGRSEGEGNAKVTLNSWYLGGDVGYNIPLEGQSFTLRASSYLGIANISSSLTLFGSEVSGSSSEFMIAPGATFFFPIGEGLTIGADGRFFIVSNASSFVINATIGKSF